MSPKQTNRKNKLAYSALAFAILAIGSFSTVGLRASYAAATSQPYEQYITEQLPAIQPIVSKELTPSGNATLPADLADIVSAGQALASKEFTASTDAANNNQSMLATRYASSGIDVYRHLLNLVMQYEYDSKNSKQAMATEQVSDLASQISRVQWQEVRIYEITTAATKLNQTVPDLGAVTTLIINAKQDIQNTISLENSNSSDLKTIEKSLWDTHKNLNQSERLLNQIWRAIEKDIDKAQGETRLDKIIARLTTTANTLQQRAENQSNTDAESEVTAALTDIQQAQNSANTGNEKTAMEFVMDAAVHLRAAAALLRV